MILREMMLDSLQYMPPPAQDAAPAAGKAKNGGTVFGDILERTAAAGKKSETAADRPAARIKPGAQDETADGRSEVRTYMEIRNEMRRDAAKPGVKAGNEKAGKPDLPDSASVKAAGGPDADDAALEKVINCFAQALGLNPGEFRQLLKAAGIAPEEMASVTDAGQLASRLSEALGLNAEQSRTLGEMLELVKTQAQAVSEPEALNKQASGENSANATADAGVLANNTAAAEIEAAGDGNSSDTGISALIVKLKLKLGELREKLDSGGEGLAEEISLQLRQGIKEAGVSADSTAGPETPAETGGARAAEDIRNAVGTDDGKKSADSRGEDKSDRKTDGGGTKPVLEAAATAVSDEQPQTAVQAAVQAQKNGETGQVERANVRTPVQAREIINQVLEKAKVVLTGDKSEMVIDLKPDSLGKLSLKVVTEHGIVMAKFVAENQQVKQVLETNMQLLKDSLEKQGMEVQGFSVSVRQDSQQGDRDWKEAGTPGRPAPGRASFVTERLTAAAERLAAAERRNPYTLETSTVNFTA
jgi:flagellar hook-length control protein FliK